MADTTRKPDGWDQLRRDGDPAGEAEVGYDPQKPAYYHVNGDGSIAYHGVPEGFHFAAGVLVPKTGDDAPPVVNVPAAPVQEGL